ncbi:hypothetical protein [Paenibacillus camerounensis]|uniref:hypothetical protein n=1 Tax=Paenibacillus camerounensis TaxID=1243663 RepID=UPI0005A5FE01|nr:hypothetical protein [Paenibacillus camerounensis]
MRNKILFISLISILLIAIAGNYYFSNHLPKSMVNHVIQKSLEGSYAELNISTQDKETLAQFFGSDLAGTDLEYSGDFTHANPSSPELHYHFERMDYDQNNTLLQTVTGNLAIRLTRPSFIKWKVEQVRIINELQKVQSR